MTQQNDQHIQELLQTIRPWFPQEQAFLLDMARTDLRARLVIGIMLAESEQLAEADRLFRSIVEVPTGENQELGAEKLRACIELAHIRMGQLKYDEAEDFLWQARNEWAVFADNAITREEISLLIAECRFGQGFVQEAIDRAEEILRKQLNDQAHPVLLAKTHQQLGWFSLHKMDVPTALQHIKTAMQLAPSLDQQLVDAAIEAEKDGNFEKAVEYYYDSIQLES